MSIMKDEYKVYLAGKMGGLTLEEMNSLRVKIIEKLESIGEVKGVKINVVNPVNFYNFEEIKHKSEKEVMNFDLYHALSSDIVLVNLEGLNTSIGTAIEIDRCYQKGIMIFGYGSKEIQSGLHPWLKEMIWRIDDNVEELAEYLNNFIFV